MTEWEKMTRIYRDSNSEYGGTMRLGSYPAVLNKKNLFLIKYTKQKKLMRGIGIVRGEYKL
ncbi:MAG: hypothetical protein CM15mP29_0110 [Alphaproteobacteria bacterium]|nr:MAG: hypothetical protein CM15mP29_0110 [Alphaproteobacteria bacterium]